MRSAIVVMFLALVACLGCNGQPSEPTVADALAAIASATPATEQALSDGLGLHRPRPASGFVPASPDTRSSLQLAQAACQAASYSPDDPEKGWRCGKRVPKPVAFAASSGQTPIIPTSWTVPAWFVNKSTGNNLNDCTTALTACATKNEIVVHRWGCVGTPEGCPRFQQDTVLEQDASDTDNTDPFYAHVALEKGASFTIKGGTPTTLATVALAGTTSKNTAVGTNSLLITTLGGSASALATILQNTTHPSRAWPYKALGGGSFSITQPFAALTIPTLAGPYPPTEVDTWANTDSVNILSQVQVNIASVSAIMTDANAGFSNAFYVYNLVVFDPLGAQSDVVDIGSNIVLVEMASQKSVSFGGTNGLGTGTAGRLAENVVFQSQVASYSGGFLASTIPALVGDPTIFGGALGFNGNQFNGPAVFSRDMILGGRVTLANGSAISGNVYLDQRLDVMSGTLFVQTSTTRLYGSAGANSNINLQGSSHEANQTGSTFATVHTAPQLVTGILLDGTATASSMCAGTINVGISTTPAHLDAACGAAGFGSAAYTWAGASVANF